MQGFVESLRSLLLLHWRDVGVDVRGDRVAEVLLDDLGVRPRHQEEAGGGVPQCVQVDTGQPGAHGEGLEPAEDVARIERGADLGREQQAGALPDVTGGKPLSRLSFPVLPQGSDGGPGERHGAP